ncbi:MAG: hypothetical protein ACE37F_36220 [Nannocystaceae bacterium]|nr:hypothetical protein [bacterium]
MKSLASCSFALLCASLTACAPAMQHAPVRPLPADLQFGRLSERTTFEQTDASGAPLPSDDDDLDDGDDAQRKRKGVFVAGVIASALGGAMAVGFGAAGQITEKRLDDGYREGLTRAEEADFRDRGEAFNTVAITGAALAVVGLGVTAIVLGIDHRKCGDLIKRRRQECKERRGR